ncbi:winged helix-turn-helix transcriptional regulator [Intestinibacter sp.]
MKIALIAPITIMDKAREVAKEFDDIELIELLYNDYKDSINILKNTPRNYDAILFGGLGAYSYCQQYFKEDVLWDYFPRHVMSFSNALLSASLLGYDIKNISCDTFSYDLIKEAYTDLSFDFSNIKVSLIEDKPLHINDSDKKNKYNQDVFKFHKNNYLKDNRTCIITALHTVNKMLKTNGIYCFTSYPSRAVIRETISKLYLKYQAKQNQKSKIVILFIEIDLPSEYSVISKDEYHYIHEKMIILDMIYEFAQHIKAAVVEASYNTYLLFSTKNILELETDNFKNISLLNEINENSLHTVSIGIGYGSTAQDAKYNANLGTIKAKQYNKNVAYIVYENKKIEGPIIPSEKNRNSNDNIIDEKLYLVSETSGISINTIFTLHNIINKYKKNHFTSKELSEACGLSIRSINRILNKLESSGYCTIVGKKIINDTGRPSRIIKFNF